MRTHTLLLTGFAALTLIGCRPRTATPSVPTPQAGHEVALTDSTLHAGQSDTLRFGRMYSGERAVKHFYVKNDSSRPFVMTHHELTCNCLTIDYARQPIRPGEQARIGVTFDSRGEYGWQMKLFKLYTSESVNPVKIFVEADIN